MKKYGLCLLLAFFALTATARAATNPVTGLWLTQNGHTVIRLEACNAAAPDKICGRIAWIIKGGMQTDMDNPNKSLRTRPLCGLPILWGFAPQDVTHWTGGYIYKADDGDTYHADLELLGPDRLRVHGYIGMPLFGVSQIWRRVTAAAYPACHPG